VAFFSLNVAKPFTIFVITSTHQYTLYITNSEPDEPIMILPPHTQELLRRFAERGSATVEDILARPNSDQAARHPRRDPVDLIAGQLAISDRCAALPVLDPRAPDEIIGYNDQGVFD
jgi:antitoxin VapB